MQLDCSRVSAVAPRPPMSRTLAWTTCTVEWCARARAVAKLNPTSPAGDSSMANTRHSNMFDSSALDPTGIGDRRQWVHSACPMLSPHRRECPPLRPVDSGRRPGVGRARPTSAGRLHRLQRGRHLTVHQIDRLQRADHHPELDDSTLVVAADDVDAVDVLALDGGLELEHGGVPGQHRLRVAEPPGRRLPGDTGRGCLAGERLARRLQVHGGDRLALLGGVDDRRVEDHLVVEQGVEAVGELTLQVRVPLFDHLLDHPTSSVGRTVLAAGHDGVRRASTMPTPANASVPMVSIRQAVVPITPGVLRTTPLLRARNMPTAQTSEPAATTNRRANASASPSGQRRRTMMATTTTTASPDRFQASCVRSRAMPGSVPSDGSTGAASSSGDRCTTWV